MVDDLVEDIDLLRTDGERKEKQKDIVVKECSLTIVLNGEKLVTLLCTPRDLKPLAVGYLLAEGFLMDLDGIESLSLDEDKGMAEIEIKGGEMVARRASSLGTVTSGCGKGTTYQDVIETIRHWRIESQKKISKEAILNLVGQLQQHSALFKATGGVHSAALADEERILVFKEDIGRHNAIDKIFGECLLEGIATNDKVVLTSGRLSSEIVLKVAKRDVPILISRTAPTSLGVKLAREMGMTLVGFVRARRTNVYANGWRILGL